MALSAALSLTTQQTPLLSTAVLWLRRVHSHAPRRRPRGDAFSSHRLLLHRAAGSGVGEVAAGAQGRLRYASLGSASVRPAPHPSSLQPYCCCMPAPMTVKTKLEINACCASYYTPANSIAEPDTSAIPRLPELDDPDWFAFGDMFRDIPCAWVAGKVLGCCWEGDAVERRRS